jgi:hypothetical protein
MFIRELTLSVLTAETACRINPGLLEDALDLRINFSELD